jgi:hypothetical protein
MVRTMSKQSGNRTPCQALHSHGPCTMRNHSGDECEATAAVVCRCAMSKQSGKGAQVHYEQTVWKGDAASGPAQPQNLDCAEQQARAGHQGLAFVHFSAQLERFV